MSRRMLFAVTAMLMLVAACGREGSLTTELAESTARPEATETPSATAAATSTPQAATTAQPTAAAGGETGQAAAQTTPRPASQGGVNPPKDGRYVYTYKGESSNPFNPGAGPERFEGELTREISHQGNVYTEERTDSEEPGRFTTRQRWEASRVLLLSFKVESPQGDFACTLDPPILIANIPIKAEKFPTQNFRGEGNACNGKIDIEFLRRESVQDANGRTWSTWRVQVRLEVTAGQARNVSNDTEWFSTELGNAIRTDGTFETQFGGQRFSGKATTALKSHP